MTRQAASAPACDYLDGAFVRPDHPDGELVLTSPADLTHTTGVYPYADPHVERALASARRAFPRLARLPLGERAAWLRRYQERLRAHRDEIALAIAFDVGKPRWEALTEVDAMIAKVDLTLGEGARYTEDRAIAELPGEIRYRPHGVIAVIGPFNFPGHLPNGQILPALLLGNCVVHKPSEHAPAASLWMARCFHEAGLPAGAFQLVHGPGTIGAALAAHPEVDGVMFTGSVAVGRRIVASQGERLDRMVALELGGKNTAIALSDCDLERSARAILFGAYATAGQRCTASSRLIVLRSVADALIARLEQLVRGLRVGHPLEADVFMGPLISEGARARVEAALTSAERSGYEARVPGGRCKAASHDGYYLRPSLHVASHAGVEVPDYTDAELFGPDLAVYVVDSDEEAFALANRSRFGLAASVFTERRERFEAAALALRVGVLHWNRPTTGASGRLPFGGLKDSGNHRPVGILAGLACAYPQAVMLAPAADDPLPRWPGTGL